MNKQTEIKESTVLLMPDGNLARPGYCKHNLFRYNPEMIKRENTMRLKEWDYYQISDGNIMIQLSLIYRLPPVPLSDLLTSRPAEK